MSVDKYRTDQRPGSAYCDEMDARAIRFQQYREAEATRAQSERAAEKAKPTRAERLKADPNAWENMAEAWEDGEPEQFECGNCGRTGDQGEIIEATRRCGTGYGEWYCAHGQGCQAKK